jgi:hypothetical protein
MAFASAMAAFGMFQASGAQTLPGTVGPAFVSFSIELAFFPDFAGNKSHPNVFSENLLNNLADLQGVKPVIRVGGNTQWVFWTSEMSRKD